MTRSVLFTVLFGCNKPPAAAPVAGGGDVAETITVERTANPDMPDTTVVATWKGGQLQYGDLAQMAGSQLTKLEIEYLQGRYQTETQALEGKLAEALVELEAASRGLQNGDALLEQEVTNKVADPTDQEIREFYKVVERQLRGAPMESVRGRLIEQLRNQKSSERYMVFITELKQKYEATTSLPFPDLPRIQVGVDDDPSLGSPDAPVTIVQFAEFQCPYCGKSKETLDRVLADYEGKVRMVFRDYPLGFHDRAIPAAVAANCAGEQGKYWEMFSELMSNQRALTDGDLAGYATTVGLDLAKWRQCQKDPSQEAEVMADFAAGNAAGVTGTPAFFINGVMLSGALPYEQFKAVIDRELEAL